MKGFEGDGIGGKYRSSTYRLILMEKSKIKVEILFLV